MPTVSILIPAYNVEKYLPQCLDSILNQTYRDLQIVVIDDGSRDGTWILMQEYAIKDNRLEIYHQENQGVAVTRNHLLDRIKGDYLLFVDADDWIEPEMVDYLVNQAEQNATDIVVCSSVSHNSDNSNKSGIPFKVWGQKEAVKAFLVHKDLNGSLWNKLIRRDSVGEISFNPAISFGEDALFIWHVLQRVKCITFTNRELYHYRMNNESLSHQRFGKKRMSGHLVWKTISRDVAVSWPEFSEIASVSYSISDMWQIYYGARDNYNKDQNIISFQENIKKHLFMIIKSRYLNLKTKVFAFLAAYSYAACKIVTRL